MRIAIFSDIHANFAALNAVLEDVRRQGEVDRYWVLGDVVGMGPEPVPCLDALLRLPGVRESWVNGNHDLAALALLGFGKRWGAYAESPDVLVDQLVPHKSFAGGSHDGSRQVIEEFHVPQLRGLPGEELAWLSEQPTWRVAESGTCLAHGIVERGSDDPINVIGRASYLMPQDWSRAGPVLATAIELSGHGSISLLVVGHNHMPFFWQARSEGMQQIWKPVWDSSRRRVSGGTRRRGQVQFPLGPLDRQPVVISPGSVGQPRDGDPRAAYAILDTSEGWVRYRRVPYPLQRVEAAMERQWWPKALASWLLERLRLGDGVAPKLSAEDKNHGI